METRRIVVKLECGIKVPFYVKTEVKGKRVIAYTDTKIKNVVFQYLHKRTRAYFMTEFTGKARKRIMLNPKYKVVVKIVEDDATASKEAVKFLRKKVDKAVQKRVDYIDNILSEIRGMLIKDAGVV